MRKKAPSRSRHLVRTPGPDNTIRSRNTASDDDLYFIAQVCHKAAKLLAGALQIDSNPFSQFDVYPVVFMYRHALEVHLKALVFEGSNFLATKPDHISVSKTRSLSWLAQFVVQIVTALGWEDQFRCDGVENLADFKAIIEDVNAVDLGHGIIRFPGDPQGQDSVGDQFRDLVSRLDALLNLLDSTADSLAAEWDLRSDGENLDADGNDGGDFGPTIQ